MKKNNYREVPVGKMAYDPKEDGVWLGEYLFLPRNVVIQAIGLLPGKPPQKERSGEK